MPALPFVLVKYHTQKRSAALWNAADPTGIYTDVQISLDAKAYEHSLHLLFSDREIMLAVLGREVYDLIVFGTSEFSDLSFVENSVIGKTVMVFHRYGPVIPSVDDLAGICVYLIILR